MTLRVLAAYLMAKKYVLWLDKLIDDDDKLIVRRKLTFLKFYSWNQGQY